MKALRIHYEADKEKLQKIKALLVGVAIINYISGCGYLITLVGVVILITLVGVAIINYISGCDF